METARQALGSFWKKQVPRLANHSQANDLAALGMTEYFRCSGLTRGVLPV
jgi:hypothetical protein